MSALDSIPYEALGKPIRGPEALTSDWSRFWHLTFNIARMQWKLRFFGSALGYFWQLARPLMMFAVLWVFFTKIGHIGSGPDSRPGQPNQFYGAQLLGSIVLFTFFAEATGNAVKSVVDNEALVRKIQFPRLVIPVSLVLLALFNLGLNLLVVFIFTFAAGVHPMLSWLELPLIVALLAVFAAGLAMLLSSLYVYFRDISPIWEVVSQVLFLRLAGNHPDHHRAGEARPRAPAHLRAEPDRDRASAVPPRGHHPRHAERRRAPGGQPRAARTDRDHARDVRARVRGVQPQRAVRGREPVGPARGRPAYLTGARFNSGTASVDGCIRRGVATSTRNCSKLSIRSSHPYRPAVRIPA